MSLSEEWNPLGDVFYRKLDVYDMEWSLEMDQEKYIIAAARYAGPIAMMLRDQNENSRVKCAIHIFTSAGILISSIKWNSGIVQNITWTDNEHLLCVQIDGTVLRYDIHGKLQGTFSLGKMAKESGVVDSRSFRNGTRAGLAVLTTGRKFVIATDVANIRLKYLPPVPGLDLIPTAWTVLTTTDHDSPTILVASQSDIYTLDHSGQWQLCTPHMSSAPYGYLLASASFTSKYIALYTEDGRIWIGNSDLQTVHCEFNTGNTSTPLQMEWCASGALVVYWTEIIMVIGPKEEYFSYGVDESYLLIPEIDGLRIISQSKHEFLQRVPNAVEDIMKIGSMKPGALLYEAYNEYQKGSEKSDEYMRTIGQSDLAEVAVPCCIEAAGAEFITNRQKSYLRAAAFGKCFLTQYSPEPFLNMCQLTRALNAIRTIGLAITYLQLEKLELSVLIDRLVYRRQYALASELCKYLNMSEESGSHRIIGHWACYKVAQTNVSDEDTARQLAAKLNEVSFEGGCGVTYAEIAGRALDAGRIQLATKLLEYEARTSEQVPLLMKMRLDDRALNKAIEYGDSDLAAPTYLDLLYYAKPRPKTRPNTASSYSIHCIAALKGHHVLWRFSDDSETISYCTFTLPAGTCITQYYRNENLEMLFDLYVQDDNYLGQGLLKVAESFKEQIFENKQSCLLTAQDCFAKCRKDFLTKQTEEQIKLRKIQRKFSDELKNDYLDLSIHNFIKALLKDNNTKQADQIRRDFKVPDKRFCWLKIISYCEIGDFVELEKFSKSKKSPIGYEPFVNICIKHNNIEESQKYLCKVVPEKRVNLLVKMGKLELAMELAYERKSVEEMSKVAVQCTHAGTKSLSERCATLTAKLRSGSKL